MDIKRIEVIVVRDPEFANDISIYIDGEPVTVDPEHGRWLGGVEIAVVDIDPGPRGATDEWLASMHERAKRLSPSAGAKVRKNANFYGPTRTWWDRMV